MHVKQRHPMHINECLWMVNHHRHQRRVYLDFCRIIKFKYLLFLGGSAIGIPGEIAGFWKAHKRYGKLPWAVLFRPAIDMCNEGFSIRKALAFSILKCKNKLWEERSFR